MSVVATGRDAARERLDRAWRRPAGLAGWIMATNHRSVGLRYMVTAFVFFAFAGVLGILMRIQLAYPNLHFLSPEAYNQVFTMHGATMMFLFAVPMMEGLGIYFVPLMIGARDMVFPRLNAFGYWVYLLSGLTLYWALLTGSAPDGGWFAYVPLTGPGYSPGAGMDYYVTAITFLEIAALVAAVELVVTILKVRAPGMSMSRAPVFVWSILVMALMIIFAMPALILASVMLGLDRLVDTHFFNPAAGGKPLLWQHLFWVFGHPEVYIIAVPGFGLISTILPTFCRRPLVGYNLVVLSTIAIGFLSFGLWVHHMYATGINLTSLYLFAAASMMIAVPSGIQVFAWIATVWRARALVFATPMLFILGFLVIFTLGGLTGVMVASVPLDFQVHDTYFVVAHFHYVLIGGAVFPLFAAFYYWFPKVTGRLLGEATGKASFWLMFVAFHVTFFPMHQLGLEGMPRRIYTYLPGLGWDELNLLATVGAIGFAAGVLLTFGNAAHALLFGRRAPADPWQAGTLEWATTSPPPNYNFQRIPVVRSRAPLWEQDDLDTDDPELSAILDSLEDSPRGLRETIGTTIVDARADFRAVLAGPSTWPLWLALAVALVFIGSMVHLVLVPIGGLLAYLCMIGWLFPRREERRRDTGMTAGSRPLPEQRPPADRPATRSAGEPGPARREWEEDGA
jgi:cytochrome c oxidase subunit I+III